MRGVIVPLDVVRDVVGLLGDAVIDAIHAEVPRARCAGCLAARRDYDDHDAATPHAPGTLPAGFKDLGERVLEHEAEHRAGCRVLQTARTERDLAAIYWSRRTKDNARARRRGA